MALQSIHCFFLPSVERREGYERDRCLDEVAPTTLHYKEDALRLAEKDDGSSLYVAYADVFTESDRLWLKTFRSRSAAPLILRAESGAVAELIAWCSEANVSFAPLNLNGPATVAQCARAAYEGFVIPELTTNKNGGALSEYFAELAEAVRREPVVLGVLALPRSGSKFVADQLVMWASPRATVFHTHSLADNRREELERDPDRRKLEKLDRTLKIVGSASRLILFTCERNPIDRIMSEFALKRHAEIKRFYEGEIPVADMMKRFDRYLKTEPPRIEAWYREQFQDLFGFDVHAHRPISQTGYAVVRGAKADLVILQTERSQELLADAGLACRHVSSNSAASRGYGELYARFKREFAVPPKIAAGLRAVCLY